MIDYIQKRKTELKAKAGLYRESVMQEYSGSSQGSSSFSGIGLIGSGLILAVFLVIRYLYPDNIPSPQGGQETGNMDTLKDGGNETPGLRDEFREKLFVVGLEILRQVLLKVVGKLKPLDEKTGVR